MENSAEQLFKSQIVDLSDDLSEIYSRSTFLMGAYVALGEKGCYEGPDMVMGGEYFSWDLKAKIANVQERMDEMRKLSRKENEPANNI